ncbi:MAG: type IV secretory system conjugative DNA transfer family protein [Pseudomonadota bacterium]
MASPFGNNAYNPHGSAQFANLGSLERGGFLNAGADKVLLGFANGHPLFFGGQGGITTVAGARSGKLTSAIAYAALGSSWDQHSIFLDVKSEIAGISELAVTQSGRHGIYWSPVKLPGAPTQHRINPLDFATADSPSLIDDLQMLSANLVQKSNAKNGNFFDSFGKQILDSVNIAITRRDGVLSFPAIHEAVTLLQSGSNKWLERVGFYMHELEGGELEFVADMEEYIANAHADPTNETFHSFVGVLTNSFACLASPALRESVSPYPDGRFDFSFGEMVKDENLYSAHFCIPQEYLQIWGPVVRSMFVSSRIHKARNPSSRPVLAVLDECGNTGGKFPFAVEANTIGAGINYRPWTIWQSLKQMNAVDDDGEDKILSSAAVQQFFGTRDYRTADLLAKRIGHETLRYFDEHTQEKAQHAKQQTLYSMMAGADPVEAALRARHYAAQSEIPQMKQRYLLTPDEILNAPQDRQIIFADNAGAPILCEKRAYYDQAFLAGAYLPNPFHPPVDSVSVKTRFGRKRCRVITERVPERFAHLPQYSDGTWRYVEGFRP